MTHVVTKQSSDAPDSYADPTGVLDCSAYIQSLVNHNILIGSVGKIFFPAGHFRLDKPIIISDFGTIYYPCSIEIHGNATPYGDWFHGTVFLPGGDFPAFIVQSGRAVKFQNISISGKYDRIAKWDLASYYDPSTWVVDSVRDNVNSPHAGIVIDPFRETVPDVDRYPGLESYYVSFGSGTSRVIIDCCHFENVVVGVGVSLDNKTQNGDNIRISNTSFAGCKSCISVGQGQNRGMLVDHCCFSTSKYAIDCCGYGQRSGGMPVIIGGMSTHVWNMFRTTSTGNANSVVGHRCESVHSIGMLHGGRGQDCFSFDGCVFNFCATPDGVSSVDYHLANMAIANFRCCSFANPEPNEPIKILNRGKTLTFDCCSFEKLNSIEPTAVAVGDNVEFRNCANAPTANKLERVAIRPQFIHTSDGVATIELSSGSVDVGDILWYYPTVYPFEYPAHNVGCNVVLGRVSGVVNNSITVEYVPQAVSDSESILFKLE